MKIHFFIVLVFLFVGNLNGFSQTVTNDAQLWSLATYEFSLDEKDEKLSGIIISDIRLTENIKGSLDVRFGGGINYKPKKNLAIQPSYIFRIDRILKQTRRYEHRLRLDVTQRRDFGSLTIDNRSRFEHRIKTNGRDDDTFYRNRTSLRIPLKKKDKLLMTSFVSNDVWLDLQNAKFFRNDLIGGINRKLTKSISAEVFYRYRLTSRVKTEHENVFGIRFRFRAKRR